MSGFVLHPDALADLNEIWKFIAADNSRVTDGFSDKSRVTLVSPNSVTLERSDLAAVTVPSRKGFSDRICTG